MSWSKSFLICRDEKVFKQLDDISQKAINAYRSGREFQILSGNIMNPRNGIYYTIALQDYVIERNNNSSLFHTSDIGSEKGNNSCVSGALNQFDQYSQISENPNNFNA